MASRRAGHHRSVSLQDSTTRRKLPVRRATATQRRVFGFNNSPYVDSPPSSHASGSSPPLSPRQVLVPLHFNLRRLPSRILSERKHDMRDEAKTSIGMKRKRAVSGNENTSARGARSSNRAKRRKALHESSDEEPVSEMDDGSGDEMEPVRSGRRLRNGKIVFKEDVDIGQQDDEEEEDPEEAEEDIQDTEDDTDEDTEEEAEEEDAEEDAGEVVEEELEEDVDDTESVVSMLGDEDAEGEEDETVDDEDVDLTVATAKTLVRLRKDDLVRLCETRDIDISGTKPQLAEALLQWRDRHCSEATTSAPSSVNTVPPPSTTRVLRRRKTRSKTGSTGLTPPVLLRSHVHVDEPRTPLLSTKTRERDGEADVELDLESLGLEDREIPPEKLTKLEKIGSGGFKDVFIGRFKGRRVAIAEFRGQLSQMDIKELKLLGDFDHPNIVRFLGVSIPENTRETPVMIVSELCSNGDLFDYIRNVNPPSLYRVLCIMLDIAKGLEYLHLRKPSIIHRDCKSSNILITSKGIAKITDFGLAKVKQSTRSMIRSLVGTVNWQAPELWHPTPKYNHKVDVFSCAMVYWEILQWHVKDQKFPWEGMNEHAIYDVVGAKKQRPSITGLRKLWCPEIVDLLEQMWAQDPADRPTMSEVVEEIERIKHLYR